MADFYAEVPVNMDTFSLCSLYRSSDAIRFGDNVEMDGAVVDMVALRYDGGESVFGIIGTGIRFDTRTNAMTAGTVTMLVDGSMDGDTYWGAVGISLSAVAVERARLTSGTADDAALMVQAFSKADTFFLSDGNDLIRSYAGNDTIDGFAGNDTIAGGSGNDIIRGGTGADRLHGGTGTDILSGGIDSSRDVFIFSTTADSSAGASRDTVRDFRTRVDDIDLIGIDANAAKAGNQVFVWGGTKATKNGVWYQDVGADMLVFADVNGDRVADFSLRLVGVASLGAGDFFL
ncbi:MAG: M10 family metallopeptidase C-terminal domain-containing protein [Pseudomonadota bacterium]